MSESTRRTEGCCQAPVPSTPELIMNRPGLSTIGYRVGTYSTFRQSMLEAIAQSPELNIWTARGSDDYGISFLDMWAYVSDIITFYQERIANEAFLRTALLRESVMRLAGLLDYKLSPGLAAIVNLAFTVEEGKHVRILTADTSAVDPVGLRVQSVPGQDEKPQTFETIESILAMASLNEVRVFPEPEEGTYFEKGAGEAILEPSEASEIAEALAPGDRFVLFDSKTGKVEELEVVSLTEVDGLTSLSWTPDLRQGPWSAMTRAFKYTRKLRVLGHNAPSTYTRGTIDSTQPGGIRWEVVSREDYDVVCSSSQSISLDRRYDDITPGTKILLHNGEETLELLTIDKVEHDLEIFEPASDTVTRITVSEPFSAFDRRRAFLYELADPEIRPWKHRYGESISGAVFCVRSDDLAVEDVERGRRVFLADGSGATEVVMLLSAREMDYDSDKNTDHHRIAFTPALTRNLDTGTAKLFGNVAKATHGETVAEELLGSGDASEGFQSFPLRKTPVTFVPQAEALHGGANTLQVRVGGIQWREVDTLYGRGSTERVFTTHIDNDGLMTVQFGNGTMGARLPSGRNNIVARYRHGLGQEGNVRADTLTTLLDRPVGLKSVVNPVAAKGGVDPENLEDARSNAPNIVRTFGRIVSLRDFEDSAREYSGVAKARASWSWDGEERVVHLVVAGDGGSDVVMKELVSYLDARRDPFQRMHVEAFKGVPVCVEAAIMVSPGYHGESVRCAADKALRAYCAFENLDIGQSIHLSDVYRVLQKVKGVEAVDINRLQYKYEADCLEHGATGEQVQGHLSIYAMELALIEEVGDVTVTIG